MPVAAGSNPFNANSKPPPGVRVKIEWCDDGCGAIIALKHNGQPAGMTTGKGCISKEEWWRAGTTHELVLTLTNKPKSPYSLTVTALKTTGGCFLADPNNPPSSGTLAPLGASIGPFKYYVIPNFQIKVMTFIECDHVVSPIGFVYGGDNRGFDPNSTSFRTFQSSIIVPEKSCNVVGLTNPVAGPGISTRYAQDDLISSSAACWTDGKVLREGATPVETAVSFQSEFTFTPHRIDDHTIQIELKGSGCVPFEPCVAPIDYELSIKISAADPANPTYEVSGRHDGFPWYEVYINNVQIYQHVTDKDIWRLFEPMEIEIEPHTGDL